MRGRCHATELIWRVFFYWRNENGKGGGEGRRDIGPWGQEWQKKREEKQRKTGGREEEEEKEVGGVLPVKGMENCQPGVEG